MNTIQKAIDFAAKAHSGQIRKSSKLPFIVHPFNVGIMLQKLNCSDEVIAAGILHDVVEDTGVTLDDIRHEFGEKVAYLVDSATEYKAASWKETKTKAIEGLKNASFEVRLIRCVDKLHNIKTLEAEQKAIGEKVWNNFKSTKQEQEWYNRECYKSMIYQNDIPDDVTVFNELKDVIDRVFR